MIATRSVGRRIAALSSTTIVATDNNIGSSYKSMLRQIRSIACAHAAIRRPQPIRYLSVVSCSSFSTTSNVTSTSNTIYSTMSFKKCNNSRSYYPSTIINSSILYSQTNNSRSYRRCFSSSNGDDGDNGEPVILINAEDMQNTILEQASEMAKELSNNGYYTTTNFLSKSIITLLRSQSITLRSMGRFEQSWSEKIIDGKTIRFDKEGVFACEPDGQDYYDAPDLIVYMSILLQTLPTALNDQMIQIPTMDAVQDLSNSSFNAKLAVTSPGGSKYPLHIDNPEGNDSGDTRKLTCILYLNPDYNKDEDGGELRILLPSSTDTKMEIVDLTPEGGRLLMFWSDEMPHEVLATSPNGNKDDPSLDRYALTVWIPTNNVTKLHNETSKFRNLKDLTFPPSA
jgi:Rps23 Pro-64 3,4-dihydroxylase Tpa1-like proline 4-hydroxylase